MKLEVGMYAYSKKCRDYGIGKIVNITERGNGFKGDLIDIQYNYSKHAIGNQDVVASHNIIDLIEVGDYVNSYKIYSIYDDDKYVNEYNLKHKKCLGKNIYDEDYQEYLIYEEDIEIIVTKEQFEAMAYKVV